MIRVLPPEIANRIAAGEVVERPASVVKELVENALDAGARRIRVEVEEGGRKLIRVVDDGSGMDAGDLAQCLLAHATSKVSSVEDLHRVATFGFRGEALASVASVSRTVVTTRRQGDALGARIVSEGGDRRPVEPAGAPFGTTVEVHNLFYNVPARRSFLKANRSELAQIVEVLTRLALPDAEWALELVSDGKSVLVTQGGGSERDRLADLFGSDIAERLLPIAGVRGATRLSGFVGPPSLVRPSSRYQHFFVNGRPIKDRKLAFAVAEAYRGLLMPRDHPVVFVYLSVDPAMVDVNVHPAKTEVRFRDPDTLFGLILRTIRATIEGTPAPTASRTPHAAGAVRPHEAAPELVFAEGESMPVLAREHAVGPGPVLSPAAAQAGPPFVQLHRSYIVTESAEGIRILDQHALHERKLFDELLARFAGAAGEDQLLLIPFVADLGAADRDLVLSRAPDLLRIGLSVDAFGEKSIALRSVPMVLRRASPERVLLAVVECLREAGRVGQRDVIEDVVAHLACRAAVKFNDALPEAEVRALLEYEQRHPEARNCPHGRTTALLLSLRELEARFQRKK